MSIEEIVRSWKTDEEAMEPNLPETPVGRELSEQELLEAIGGVPPSCTFVQTCMVFTECHFTH